MRDFWFDAWRSREGKTSDVKITVGGAMEAEAARRFADAWHRAGRGETFSERHIAFESWDALARVLTSERLGLLRYVREHPAASEQALAEALGRDRDSVHADVLALTDAGLLDATETTVSVAYDRIETTIAL